MSLMPIVIRPAVAADQATIRRIVRAARINPLSLQWQHFLVATDDARIVGIGQVRQHRDGSRELASIATLPAYQRQGIASQIIRALIARERGVVYLTCRAELEPFYARFGFRRIGRDETSPYFRRFARFLRFWNGIIMKRTPEKDDERHVRSPISSL